ncbi:hypothetical protein BKA69DRAFT_1125459 [Paraphysoderma sedebokerense]|nr:hypothetical protein BKA69DRAFT_1125459 [Paraphysoderma sedebokerense]
MSSIILALLAIQFTATVFNPSGLLVNAVPSRGVFSVKDEIFQTQKVRFLNTNPYLSLRVPFKPVEELFNEVQKSNFHVPGRNLKNSGEAHITVISRSEYRRLQPIISISEINKIAESSKIQSTPFTIKCLGRSLSFASDPSGPAAESVYLIIDAPGLTAIRQKVWQEYVKRGGKQDDFKWDQYYPHLTVGYSPKDLHFEEGLKKDEAICAARVDVVKS